MGALQCIATEGTGTASAVATSPGAALTAAENIAPVVSKHSLHAPQFSLGKEALHSRQRLHRSSTRGSIAALRRHPPAHPPALLEPPISHSGRDSVCSHTRIMWVNESSVYATMNTTPQSSPARDRFPSAVLVESGPACQGGTTRGQCRRDAARETTPGKARLASVAWGPPPKSREWLSPQLYR